MKLVKRLGSAFAIVAGLSACNEEAFLSDATLNTSTVLAPSSNLDIDDYVRGAYFNLKSPGEWGILDLSKVHGNIVTHMVEQQPFSEGSRSGSFNVQPLYLRQNQENVFSALTLGFRGAYNVLQSANSVLYFYEERGGTIDDANKAWIPRIKGEAYFLRAFAHFSLAKIFALPFASNQSAPSIILMQKPSLLSTDLSSRSTNKEVYDLIVSDLIKAIELLPEKYLPGIHPETYQDRAQRDAARAVLAEVYFLMGKDFWPKALEQCNAILGTGNTKYPLVKTALRIGIYTFQAIGQRSTETLWHVPFYLRNAWRTPRMATIYSGNGTARTRGFSMSNSMVTSLGWDVATEAAKDLRYKDWFVRYDKGKDPLYTSDYQRAFHVWSTKFQGALSNLPMFRAPEFILMRARIQFETGNTAAALADVNITRQRAGLPALTTLTLKNIDDEWYKELGFEGTELMYLQAQKRAIPPGDRGGADIPYDHESLVWRFPQEELSRNPLSN
jgi:starch-binding outer membrane protein, SusD/RagB family